MGDFCCWRASYYEAPPDVDVGVVVNKLRASVSASRTSQARIQRDTIVFVVPRVVDDVQLVSRVE